MSQAYRIPGLPRPVFDYEGLRPRIRTVSLESEVLLGRLPPEHLYHLLLALMMSLEKNVVRKAASIATSAYDVNRLGEATLGKLRDERRALQ